MKRNTSSWKLLSVLTCLIIFSACSKKEKYSLEYKFSSGDSFTQKVEMEASIAQIYNGENVTMATNVISQVNYQIKESNENHFALDFTYEKIKMEMNLGPTKIRINSDTENNIATEKNLSPLFKAATGIPLHFSIDKKGQQQPFNGLEDIYTSMKNVAHPDIDKQTWDQMLKDMRQQISENFIQSLLKNTFLQFPEQEIAIGDSWKVKTQFSNQGTNYPYVLMITLKDVEANKATLTYHAILAFPKDVSMKGTTEGSAIIDLSSGIFTQSNMEQKIERTISRAGTEHSQVITTKVKINSL